MRGYGLGLRWDTPKESHPPKDWVPLPDHVHNTDSCWGLVDMASDVPQTLQTYGQHETPRRRLVG